MECRILEEIIRSLSPTSSSLQRKWSTRHSQIFIQVTILKGNSIFFFVGEQTLLASFSKQTQHCFLATSSIGNCSNCYRPSELVKVPLLVKFFSCFPMPHLRSLQFFFMIWFPDPSTFSSPFLEIFVNVSFKCGIQNWMGSSEWNQVQQWHLCSVHNNSINSAKNYIWYVSALSEIGLYQLCS